MYTDQTLLNLGARYNPILDTDGYKIGHHLQYPEGSTEMFSYIESRGGEYDQVLFFGLQYIIQQYISKPIEQWMIDEAEQLFAEYGIGKSFNKAGWQYILDHYDGYIPFIIKAVPEGTVVKGKNILASIHYFDPNVFWVVSYFETMLMRVWAPITTATKSFHVKKCIREAYIKSTSYKVDQHFTDGEFSPLLFNLHDFGSRGASSYESASICGAAHLVNFLGTDTVSALVLARDHYGAKTSAGFTIDAAEHSTMTALGPKGEPLQFDRMIDQFGGRDMFACVSDGFDIFNAIDNIWGEQLIEKVKQMNATLVIRPDSGDPVEVPMECIKRLDAKYGHTINDKGFKVLNHVRVIQGDGINPTHVTELCKRCLDAGYSIENLAFGMGGGLLQDMTRDTLKFACKNSWMRIDGKSVDVYKDPVTDPGKTSKKGRMTLVRDNITGEMSTVQQLSDREFDNYDKYHGDTHTEVLEVVYNCGMITKTYTLDEIRRTAEQYL